MAAPLDLCWLRLNLFLREPVLDKQPARVLPFTGSDHIHNNVSETNAKVGVSEMANRTNRKTRVQTGEEGKSLLEMAIVVMIISVVIAFAIPAVANSIRSYNLRSACERIAQRLTGARSLAMAKNKNVTVSFTTNAGGNVTQYGYDFSLPADGTPDVSDPDDPSTSYYIETPPSGITVTFTAGGTTLANGKGVTYTSRGELPIAASQADIRVSNGSGTLTVSVNLRGQVWVH